MLAGTLEKRVIPQCTLALPLLFYKYRHYPPTSIAAVKHRKLGFIFQPEHRKLGPGAKHRHYVRRVPRRALFLISPFCFFVEFSSPEPASGEKSAGPTG
jgi:hypothetical protein